MVSITALSISSTRTEKDDKSGQLLCDLITSSGFDLSTYQIVIDDKVLIKNAFQESVKYSDVIHGNKKIQTK